MLQTAQDQKGFKSTQDHVVAKGSHDSVDQEAASKRASRTAPLRARIDDLEKQTGSLRERLSALELEVGPELPPGGEPPAALYSSTHKVVGKRKRGVSIPPTLDLVGDKEDTDADDGGSGAEASVLQTNGASIQDSSIKDSSITDSRDSDTVDASIKERVVSLETDMAQLKGQTDQLEKQVMWSTANAALLDVGMGSGGLGSGSEAGTSWRARIVSLEDEADALESRVTELEHKVSG
jgi:polyhydroxyalkanoate synthesis regulator phasin